MIWNYLACPAGRIRSTGKDASITIRRGAEQVARGIPGHPNRPAAVSRAVPPGKRIQHGCVGSSKKRRNQGIFAKSTSHNYSQAGHDSTGGIKLPRSRLPDNFMSRWPKTADRSQCRPSDDFRIACHPQRNSHGSFRSIRKPFETYKFGLCLAPATAR